MKKELDEKMLDEVTGGVKVNMVAQKADLLAQKTNIIAQKTDMLNQKVDIIAQKADLLNVRADGVCQPNGVCNTVHDGGYCTVGPDGKDKGICTNKGC